jgi:hypothetical protein
MCFRLNQDREAHNRNTADNLFNCGDLPVDGRVPRFPLVVRRDNHQIFESTHGMLGQAQPRCRFD